MDGEAPERFIDGLLQAFVEAVNDTFGQIAITLLVGGSWVTGTLIPPRMWTEEVRALVQASPIGDDVAPFFAVGGRVWFPADAELDNDPDLLRRSDPPHHVHLRDGRIVNTIGQVPTDGALVRIRLDQVAGWTLGELRITPPNPPTPG